MHLQRSTPAYPSTPLALAAPALVTCILALATGCGGDDGASGPELGTGGASTASGGSSGVGGSGAGASGTGGTGAGSAPLPPSEPAAPPELAGFELIFHDDFDTFDTSRWQKASHTFDENAAQFAASQVTVEGGYLTLTLEPSAAPTADDRSFISGEARTVESFSYGRFEVRARFAPGSGVVSSLFTYYDHWADPALPENWNEIDVEFLGAHTDQVQFNVIHWNASDVRTTHEHEWLTGFDPAAEFHVYVIEWLPTVVNFYVDGALAHTQTDQIAEFLTLDQRMMMNVWPVQDTAALNSWAGRYESGSSSTSAHYDWARVYRYVGN